MKRWLLIVPAVLVMVLFLSVVADITVARSRTPGLVRAALDSSQTTFQASALSPEQLDILIRVEDPAFYTHHGIDLKTPGAGLTTITQSIGKWLYFNPFKPGIRKFRLMWLARFAVDPLVSKQDQLTLFLNYGWFGRMDGTPVIGLDQAAHVYYNAAIPDLDRHAYISLIGMFPFPSELDPLYHAEANAERVRRIEAYLSGEIVPNGVMDIYYDGSSVVMPRAPEEGNKQ